MPYREVKLDAAINSFQEQAARAADRKDRIAELRGSARNTDGSVTVTVAPSGAVLGLQLSPLAHIAGSREAASHPAVSPVCWSRHE
jgi:hypothetical protein